MGDKKITTADIARQAGVSPATVSRVLNHRELVKETTVVQVEHAMAALGYPPRPTHEIVFNSREIIIINIPQGVNPFYEEVVRGAITSANAHGYSILLNYDFLDAGTIYNFCHLLKKIHASGVILLNQLREDILQQINAVAPVVQCCEYNKNSNLPFVSIDDFTAARNATEYLISTGRNKVAFVNGPLQYKYARERKEGFLKAMSDADLFIPQNWILQIPEVNYNMAYSAVCQLLSSDQRPNAFFAVSDIFAAAIIRAAKRYSLHVPRDIMVVGFDNVDISIMMAPSITTVSQPKFQLGYTACELLLESITNPHTPPKSLLLATELIIRESTRTATGNYNK